MGGIFNLRHHIHQLQYGYMWHESSSHLTGVFILTSCILNMALLGQNFWNGIQRISMKLDTFD